jgi:hypothetical protein
MNSRDNHPVKPELQLSEQVREVASIAIMYAIIGLIFDAFMRYYPG